MADNAQLFKYLVRLGDNSLVLGQRLSEWCGHGPVLEQDIAVTNIALDLIGQTRSWYQYAALLEGEGRDEDQLAFLRDAWDFQNVLLVEQPNEDWAYTMVRQFLFDAFNYEMNRRLTQSMDAQVAAIAEKSLKEITYHRRFSSEWVIRLGDGTELSNQKMQAALDDLWMFSGELTKPDALDETMHLAGIAPDLHEIRPVYYSYVNDILKRAKLQPPANDWMQWGGKEGTHSEHLGFLLAEMQFMQRTYPNSVW